MAREILTSPGVAQSPRRQLSALQGSIGNQAILRNQSILLNLAPGVAIQRKVETIEGEQVECADDKEKAEAEAIIKKLKGTYGLDVNSTKGIEAIKTQYTNVPKTVTDALETRRWEMIELRAVLKCMEHYAPIIGASRETSTRKDDPQEVAVVGKVKQAIDRNTSTGALDVTTLGEYFKATKTMNIFKTHEGNKSVFGDEGKELLGSFVHEMAHGLLAYAYDDFVKSTDGYWTDQSTKSGKAGAEAPITTYGNTNAREDMCEAAMYYFIEPDTLKNGRGGAKGKPLNPAPLRFAFMEKITNKWLPPPPAPVEPGKAPEAVTPGKPPEAPKPKPWWNFWS